MSKPSVNVELVLEYFIKNPIPIYGLRESDQPTKDAFMMELYNVRIKSKTDHDRDYRHMVATDYPTICSTFENLCVYTKEKHQNDPMHWIKMDVMYMFDGRLADALEECINIVIV